MLKEELRIDDPAWYTGRTFRYLISWSTKGPDEVKIHAGVFREQVLKGGTIIATSSTPLRNEADLEKVARMIEQSLIKRMKNLRGKIEGEVLIQSFSLFQD